MTLIYKIQPASLWRAAEAAGSYAGAPVDLADGFIHFSTADQVQVPWGSDAAVGGPARAALEQLRDDLGSRAPACSKVSGRCSSDGIRIIVGVEGRDGEGEGNGLWAS